MDSKPEGSYRASYTWRGLILLALPVLCEEFGNILVGFTDWYLVGRFIGTSESQAAMALLAYAMWLIPCFFSAIYIGSTALVARSVGAGDYKTASHFTNQSLGLGLVLSTVTLVVVWFGSPYFAQAMQLEVGAEKLATEYLRIIALAMPFIMTEQVLSACLRGAGDTWTGFKAKIVVNLLNFIFSAGFVTGFSIFPYLGWSGLAIGTAIGHVVAGSWLMLVIIRGRAGLKFSLHDCRPDWESLRRIGRIGLPGGIDQLSVIFCSMIYVAVINRLGTVPAAAHGLGLQIESMSYLPGSAFHVAAATMAGQALGAKQPHDAKLSVMRATILAACVMCVAGTIFYFGGEQLALFFNGNKIDAVTILTTKLLKIVPFCCPFLAVVIVVSGGLRGVGDTRWPLVITLLGFFGVRIPLALWFAWQEVPLGLITVTGWGWGAEGAWIAMVLDIIVRSLLLGFRFLYGAWQKVTV